MMKFHGLLGLILILLGQLIIITKTQPFANYYYYFIWFGYILFVDSLVFSLRKKSLFMNDKKELMRLFIFSVIFWWIFEFFNIFIRNWYYMNTVGPKWLTYSIAFSTVLPAVYETSQLVRASKIFSKINLKMRLTQQDIYGMISIGIVLMICAIIYPYFFFWALWLFPFLILDPINYLSKSLSVLKHVEKKKWETILSFMLGALICGIFWEFWNYWAVPKWHYYIPLLHQIPVIGNFKIFEMYLLGYFGYLPFGLCLFSMYNFAKGLLKSK